MQNFKFLAVFGTIMLMLQGLYAQYEGQVNFNPSDVNIEQTDGWDIATLHSASLKQSPCGGTCALAINHNIPVFIFL